MAQLALSPELAFSVPQLANFWLPSLLNPFTWTTFSVLVQLTSSAPVSGWARNRNSFQCLSLFPSPFFTEPSLSPCPFTKLVPDIRSRILFKLVALFYRFLKTLISSPRPSPTKPQLWMLVSRLSSRTWIYSLGVIGKSRKSWLRETIEMTVENIKAVAAHLRCHHQVLGAVGSSIGPSQWAQSSWSGIHSSNWGTPRAQSQVRYVLPSIIPVCVLVVLERPRTGARYGRGLIPMTVRSAPRQFGLLHPTTAGCQLGLKWRNTASLSHPASQPAAQSTAEPWRGEGGEKKHKSNTQNSYRWKTNSGFLASAQGSEKLDFAAKEEENPRNVQLSMELKPAQWAECVFLHMNRECVHHTHEITLLKLLVRGTEHCNRQLIKQKINYKETKKTQPTKHNQPSHKENETSGV